MKRKIFAALLLMTSIAVWLGCEKEDETSASTTGTIYGTVTDFLTKEPISGVNVTLKPGGKTTLTGSEGNFEFPDIKPGEYSLKFSKAEYLDLDDDYIIEVEPGKSSPRDVQLKKQMASLQIREMGEQEKVLTSLDFGMEESVTSKSFNIFNNGTVNINCVLSYNCVWIDTIIAAGTSIVPGQTVAVTVIIDRAKLSSGENRTYLHIVSNNGNNELLITATGYGSPTVTTNAVSSITANSAICGGNVTSDGGNAVTDRGLCWGTSNAPSLERGDSHLSIGNGKGTFSGTLTGLSLNTVYYVRAYATNARGTAYGEEKQFTTKDGKPTVTMNAVSNITATSAVCGGSISSNGGFAVTDKGLVWGTSQYPTINDNHLSFGSGEAPFTGSMTNLSVNTTYYVRAYATNANGTSYSEQKSFTTANGLPKVTTTKSSLSGTKVISGGNVTSDGGFPVTARGICYGVYPNPDISNTYSHTEDGTGTGYFTSTISQPSGIIYIRAYATNANGTVYGEQTIYDPEYVDLGLPSGTKWKKTNASNFYTYDEAVNTFGKKLPTKTQWEELKGQCQWSWTGSGYKVTGSNGNSITLPAAGYRACNGHTARGGSSGNYWSSTPNGSGEAWDLYFTSSSVNMDSYDRCGGHSVRLVQD